MNQIDTIKKAKRKFPKHKRLYVTVKKHASVPYEKSFFHKIIADSKNPKLKHKNFILYIHDNTLTINSDGFLFEPVRVSLHDELWVELYKVFDLRNPNDN